jgi:hypothetical protein
MVIGSAVKEGIKAAQSAGEWYQNASECGARYEAEDRKAMEEEIAKRVQGAVRAVNKRVQEWLDRTYGVPDPSMLY